MQLFGIFLCLFYEAKFFVIIQRNIFFDKLNSYVFLLIIRHLSLRLCVFAFVFFGSGHAGSGVMVGNLSLRLKKILICGFCSGFMLFSALILTVAATAAEKDSLVLDEMVVEATGLAEDFRTGDVDPEQLTSFSSVIDLEGVDPGITSLGDLLAKEVGIQVRSSGGLGGYSSVSLRGSSGDQVFVYLDGVLLNDASGGGVNLALVPLSEVAAIEVYRGISPVNFARAGLGGVINIRTRRSQAGTNGTIGFGLGSFSSERLFTSLNHQTENRFDFIGLAEYISSDNDFKFLHNNGTDWNSDDDRREKRNNNELWRHSLMLKAGHDFSDDLRFEISEQYFNQDRRLPAWNNSPAANTHFETESHQVVARLQADDFSSLHLNLASQFFYGWKEEFYNDSQGILGLGRQHELYNTEKYGVSLFGEWPTEFQVLTANLETGRETYEAKDLLHSRPRGDSRRNYFSAAFQDSIYLFNRRLLLTPACHYQWYDDRLESVESDHGGDIPGQKRRNDFFSPSLGARLNLWGPFSIRANIASYSREPSFYELFGDRGFVVGNPALKAEDGENYDVGLQCVWPTKWSFLSRLEVETVLFYSKIDNLITRIYDARGVGKSENIAAARISGIEARATLDFGSYFRLLANATWQDSENCGQIAAFKGMELPGRWRENYLVRLESSYHWFHCYLEYQHESKMYYDAANLLPAASKDLVNLGLTMTLSLPTNELVFDIEMKNLGGDEYQDFNGYPMPEQEIFFNVAYHF